MVTLITNNEGYPAGALAIAAALEVFGSQLRRIVLVTSEVQPGIQDLLRSASWEVMQVEPILCNQVLGAHVTPVRYDLGSDYQQKKARWLTTCTKFHVRRAAAAAAARPRPRPRPWPSLLASPRRRLDAKPAPRATGVEPHLPEEAHLPRRRHDARQAD